MRRPSCSPSRTTLASSTHLIHAAGHGFLRRRDIPCSQPGTAPSAVLPSGSTRVTGPGPRSTPGEGPIAPTPYSRSRGEESCCWRTRRRAPPKDATVRCCDGRSRRHCRRSVKEATKLSRRSSPLVVRCRRLLSRGDEETDGGANCRHIFSSIRVVWYVASRIFSFSCVARHPRTRVCRGWNLLPLGNQNPPRCMLPFYNPLTLCAAGYC